MEEYKATAWITPQTASKIERHLLGCPRMYYDSFGFAENAGRFKTRVSFPGGYDIELRVWECTEERKGYAEAILYENCGIDFGTEIMRSEKRQEFLREWVFERCDKRFIAKVEIAE